MPNAATPSLPQLVLDYGSYLNTTLDATPDPQLQSENNVEETLEDDSTKVAVMRLLFVAMARSRGWRVRHVQAMDPISAHIVDANHPLLQLWSNASRTEIDTDITTFSGYKYEHF